MIFSANYIMAKTMNKRSGHKRSRRAAKKAHKASGHKRTAKKERRGTHGYRKGSKSKTMKGRKDFTTKKTSKVFNRRKHYQKHAKGSRVVRKPYHKKGGVSTLKDAYAKPNLMVGLTHGPYKSAGSPQPGLAISGGAATAFANAVNKVMRGTGTQIGVKNSVTQNTTASAAAAKNTAAIKALPAQKAAYQQSLAKFEAQISKDTKLTSAQKQQAIKNWKSMFSPPTASKVNWTGANYFTGTSSDMNSKDSINIGLNNVGKGELLTQAGLTGGSEMKSYLSRHPAKAKALAEVLLAFYTKDLTKNAEGPSWSAADITASTSDALAKIEEQLTGEGTALTGKATGIYRV